MKNAMGFEWKFDVFLSLIQFKSSPVNFCVYFLFTLYIEILPCLVYQHQFAQSFVYDDTDEETDFTDQNRRLHEENFEEREQVRYNAKP